MPNRLTHANSPYLLQHKDNPVDWYPWTDQALRKAQDEGKPIFLSIGYAACHWCHVMAHESFEDPETAAIMNRHFVNIKVDREERPDLDSLYMNAVVNLTGQGGWPMSVFLTPDGIPFYAGTYFPPVRRYNMPAFKDVLLSLADAWYTERERVQQASLEIVDALNKSSITDQLPSTPLERTSIDLAVKRLHDGYDWDKGGWGKAPKFPQPMAIQFLLAQGVAGDSAALELAVHALKSMARGGMYDVIGGGFSRYSTDDDWLVPHFEKMLYDNAQLARVYLHAYLITREPWFREICEQTIDFVLHELTGPDGGFYSSLDADSEGEEGKFYLWSLPEIQNILGDSDRFKLFKSAYNLDSSGNFEGQIILQRHREDEALADEFLLDLDQVHETLNSCHQQLFQARSYRVRPSTDDKVLVSWNALMLITLSEAARYLSRQDYLETATRNADFLLNEMFHENHLLRSWRNGKAHLNAYLEDYANLVIGLVSLYQSSHQISYLVFAEQLTSTMIESFYDAEQGFFDTRHDQDNLFMRPRDIQDNAVPSGTSLAVQALLQMAALYGHGEWREIAETTLRPMQPALIQYPTAFASWLFGLYLAVSGIKEVAILGDPESPGMILLIDEVWKKFRPDVILAVSKYPPPQDSPPLLENRSLLCEKPTAYICRNFICNLPVTDPEGLAQQMD